MDEIKSGFLSALLHCHRDCEGNQELAKWLIEKQIA
jgi:hypothetical protein